MEVCYFYLKARFRIQEGVGFQWYHNDYQSAISREYHNFFDSFHWYNPTSQEIYNCRRERLKVQACAVREKQVMLGKIGPLGWNTKKYLTETKIKIRNKNWILQLFSFKVHVIPQIPFFLSSPHPLKKYTNYKTKTAMLQSTLIRETNWKVQLLRNTQIVWSYPPYITLFSTRRYVYLTIILPFLISP